MAVAIFAAPATLWRVGDGRFSPVPTIVAVARARRDRRLRRSSGSTAPRERDRARRQAAADAARRLAGRVVRAGEQGRDRAGATSSCPSAGAASAGRGRRVTHLHVAGIGRSRSFCRAIRRRSATSCRCSAPTRPDHRRRAHGRRSRGGIRAITIPSRSSGATAFCASATTSGISCRSASTFRSSPSWKGPA